MPSLPGIIARSVLVPALSSPPPHPHPLPRAPSSSPVPAPACRGHGARPPGLFAALVWPPVPAWHGPDTACPPRCGARPSMAPYPGVARALRARTRPPPRLGPSPRGVHDATLARVLSHLPAARPLHSSTVVAPVLARPPSARSRHARPGLGRRGPDTARPQLAWSWCPCVAWPPYSWLGPGARPARPTRSVVPRRACDVPVYP
eukprot:XP_020397817.1 basic proline-rich protein-like [Zea mays]